MTIRVYSGSTLVEVVEVTADKLDQVVDYWIENGYRVRVA